VGINRVTMRRRLRRPRQSGGLAALRFAAIGLVSLLFGFVAVAFLSVGSVYAVYTSYVKELPSAEEIGRRSVEAFETTRLYDRTGQVVLYEIIPPDGGRRTEVPLDQIPEHLRNATIAVEDKTYYTNPGGINVRGLARAVWGLISDEYAGGGSSITQQLVRNVIMTYEERTERSYSRKVKELVLAYELTRQYPGREGRDRILEWYLNNINYGRMAIGVQAAAQTYFNKDVQDLTLAECAMLVPLGNSPALNPIDRPEEAKRRQEIVLDEMYLQGYITAEEAWEAKQQPIIVDPPPFEMVAPHYVVYVRDLLVERFGSETVYGGGLQVITAVDLKTQDQATQFARKHLEEFGPGHNANNAAVVVIDNRTGEIRAMVGSVDFRDASIDGQVNMAVSPRQPGSSFKPFTYATAFAQGLTPATMVMDVRTSFPDDPNPPYVPENYDHRFFGPMTIRQALACSRNIPAVAVLQQVGVANVVETARAMGVTSLTAARYGLSLTLGSAGISPLEMAYAFSVFANGGRMVGAPAEEEYRAPGLRQLDPVAILKVTDPAGNVLYEYERPEEKQVISPEVAFLITDILSDNVARTPAFGADSVLKLGDRPAAVKTGTTNDYHDAWTVGYTPQYTVSVWVGNADHSQMRSAPGSRAAAPIWHNVMKWLHMDLPVESFVRPSGIVSVVVDATSGKLPTEYSPSRMQELFIEGHEPTEEDDVHRPYRICLESGKLATAYCPPESVEVQVFEIYPPEADDWVRQQGIPQPPREHCTIHGPNLSAQPVSITSPYLFQKVRGVVAVMGNARPDGLERYWLEYGQGMHPEAWVRIGEEHSHSVDNNILEHWDTTGLSGLQTLRLNVVAHGALQQFTVSVLVDATPPSVRIVSPYSGKRYSVGDDGYVNIQVDAHDDTAMDRVEFLLNGQSLGFSTVAPYTWKWTLGGGDRGTHTIEAVAYDAAGNEARSEPVEITVN